MTGNWAEGRGKVYRRGWLRPGKYSILRLVELQKPVLCNRQPPSAYVSFCLPAVQQCDDQFCAALGSPPSHSRHAVTDRLSRRRRVCDPQKMFVVPKGKMFREYFDEQLAMFRKVTEEMPEEKVVRMVRDPLCEYNTVLWEGTRSMITTLSCEYNSPL